MKIASFFLTLLFELLVLVALVRATKYSGATLLSFFGSLAIVIVLQVAYFSFAFFITVLAGGSTLDFMALLGGTLEKEHLAQTFYVVSIFWEEVVKLATLSFFVYNIPIPSRSLGTFLVPGFLFGLAEGLQSIYILITVVILDTDLGATIFQIPIVMFGPFFGIFGHALLTANYFLFFQLFSNRGIGFVLALLINTLLHLLYNSRLAPELKILITNDGLASPTTWWTVSVAILILIIVIRMINIPFVNRPYSS